MVNGFMIALIHTSKTSPKNPRSASSVCGLVGLLGMPVLALLELDFPLLVTDLVDGIDVYGANGGKVVDVTWGIWGY